MAIHLCGIPADWQHPSDRPCPGKFNGRWRLASRLLVHSRLVARNWLERLAWAQIATEQGYEASGSLAQTAALYGTSRDEFKDCIAQRVEGGAE
ncbi:hypothetical protein M2368_001963 [Arthrobacter sp. JUb119]|nr:hypothetical protein [Arthrobacter sp. JUb119]